MQAENPFRYQFTIHLERLFDRLRHRQPPLGNRYPSRAFPRFRAIARTPTRQKRPATDGERIYAHIGDLGTIALT